MYMNSMLVQVSKTCAEISQIANLVSRSNALCSMIDGFEVEY